MKTLLSVFLCLAFSFTASAHVASDFASRPEVKAPRKVAQSFKVASAPALANVAKLFPDNGLNLVLAKDSLDKEFLLQAGFIPQPTIPLGNSLRSRIVMFHLVGNRVYLLEATSGQAISDELPQTLIITSFPIVDEKLDTVTIDFNAGMSEIFATADWKASDFEGSFPNSEYISVKTKNSFLKKLEIQDNRLVAHQVASLDIPFEGQYLSSTVEVRYYLTPYEPNVGFEPTKTTDFTRMGFFEVAPVFAKDGEPLIHASKFDIRKPIVFAISANTPTAFREAVRDGILYFNKVLGEGKIQVVDAAAGATTPDFHQNIVQWVKWDEGMGAYADAQMDPRTGEILHAQVYMGSVFAYMGKKEARRILARLKNSNNKTKPQFALKGFRPFAFCDLADTKNFQRMLEQVVLADADDAAALKAAQDYVREVVAHEIGHTLGLRHNFAGSLASNISYDDKQKVFLDYITGKAEPKGVITTSSVMDYSVIADAVITGYHIVHSSEAMAYDSKALQTLYFAKKFAESELPLFCTDTHTSTYLDCMRFDEGKEPLRDLAASQKAVYDSLADRLFEEFLSHKDAKDKGRIPNFGFDPEIFVLMMNWDRIAFPFSLTDGVRFLRVARSFPNTSPVYERGMQAGFVRLLEEQYARLGGISSVMRGFPIERLNTEEQRFGEILSARGADEGLSAEEITEIRVLAPRVFQQLPEAFLQGEIRELSNGTYPGKRVFRDHALADEFAATTANFASSVIFAVKDETIEAEIQIPAEKADTAPRSARISLPKFRYDLATRVAAAGILNPNRSATPLWGMMERSAMRDRLKKMIEDGMQAPGEKFQLTKLPTPVARWLVEARKVLAAIPE